MNMQKCTLKIKTSTAHWANAKLTTGIDTNDTQALKTVLYTQEFRKVLP